MTIVTADDLIKNWMDISHQMKQLLSKSDPSSVTKVSKKSLMDKGTITREKFAELVMTMHSFGSSAHDWAKSQNDSKQCLKADLKGLLPEVIKEAMILMKPVISADLKELTPAAVKEAMTTVNLLDNRANLQETNDTETYTLVVEDKMPDGTAQPFTPTKWSDIVRNTMSQKLEEIPVKKSLLTESGKAIMRFPDLQSREAAAEALADDFVIAKQVSKVQKLLPKIKICDLRNYKKEDSEKLKSDISKKNPTIRALVDGGATLDIIFIRESVNPSGYGYAIVKVDPRIREEIIKNQRRIYISTTSFYVKDQIHVTQCFACQQFGHKRGSPHCRFAKTDKHLCLYCAKNCHLSKDCPIKGNSSKYNCVNCKNTGRYANLSNHTSTSSMCPIFAKEAESVIKRTVCDSKNFPILRTIQRQF